MHLSLEFRTGLFWGVKVSSLIENRNRIVDPCKLVEIASCDDVDIDYYDDLKYYIPQLEIIAATLK